MRRLDVGESLTFPVYRLPLIRNYASELSLVMGRRYATTIDRERLTITATRVE